MKWIHTNNGKSDAAGGHNQLVSGAFAVDAHVALIQTIVLQLDLRKSVNMEIHKKPSSLGQTWSCLLLRTNAVLWREAVSESYADTVGFLI